MKKTITVFTAAAVLLSLSSLPAEESTDVVESLRDGKAKMEQYCVLCHSLSRVLSKTTDRKGWDDTVKRMVTHGAPFNTEFRASVVNYLTAKSSFETHCNACHSNLRVLSSKALGADWMATTGRMAKHMEELSHKDPEARLLSEEDIRNIAAYLTIVIPKD